LVEDAVLLRLFFLGALLALSLGLGLYLTPLVQRAAIRFGVFDHPDGVLKRHAAPVPYLGGVAVYLAFLVSLAVVFDFEPTLLGLLLGGTMVAMLGLFDDLRVLPPRLKFAGQLLATWVLIKSGIAIALVALPVWVAWPLSFLWIAGITNAFNIIDVSDGLAGGVAAIAGVGLFVIAVDNGDALIAATTLALVGSIIGFLRYNQPPASIYLGDTGSMFIGFMLAALAMIGAYTRHSPAGALAPLLIVWVPILDTVLVSVARLRQGIPPWRGSPDHFAIRLKARGWSAKRVAAFAYAFGLVGAAGGIGLTYLPLTAALFLGAAHALVFVATLVWLWRMPTAPRLQSEIGRDPARATQAPLDGLP
jgi:UDP-GlcNAc:undecaprenyl-phosphate GlcNAc-1-phosphate transferase